MTSQEMMILGALGAAVIVLVIFLVRILILIRHLNASFAKLGFLVREDAKKYFDDAAGKIVDTNEQFQHMYQKIVEDGTRAVLAESGTVMEKAIAEAHEQANVIVLTARTDAQQIVQAAHTEASNHHDKTLQRTGDAISWVISQYLGEVYSTAQHEALIEKQVKAYVDEHRR